MAAWKPKEKPLTMEEAVELAKKDLAPLWFGSEPLLTAIPAGKKFVAYPLNPKITSQPWILLFIDPMDFATENALAQAKEWSKRYSQYNLNVILCIRPCFEILRKIEFITQFLKKNSINYAATLDLSGMLSAAFSVNEMPRAMLLSQGHVIFHEVGEANFHRLEESIQPFLRKTDPGLSLQPSRESQKNQKKDLARLNFSDVKIFPAPGFKTMANGVQIGKFVATPSAKKEERPFQITGTWAKVGEKIITSDPQATITLSSSAAFISIIAQAPTGSENAAEIEIELNAHPPYDEILGQDLDFGEDGNAFARIREPRLYHLLAQMPQQLREVTLRFPSANHCPVELYGIRFGI